MCLGAVYVRPKIQMCGKTKVWVNTQIGKTLIFQVIVYDVFVFFRIFCRILYVREVPGNGHVNVNPPWSSIVVGAAVVGATLGGATVRC